MSKKKVSGTPINMDIVNQGEEMVKASANKRARTVNKTKLINKYGVTGVVENTIPEKLQDKKYIKKIQDLLEQIKKYGNPDTYEVIPAELKKKMEDNQDFFEYIGKKGEKVDKPVFSQGSRTHWVIPAGFVYCLKCGGYKSKNFYFDTMAPTASGFLNICKNCLEKMCKDFYNQTQDLEHTLILMCLHTNTIYRKDCADKAIGNVESQGEKPTKLYEMYRRELTFSLINRNYNPKVNTFEYSNFEGNIFKFMTPDKHTPKAIFEDQNSEIMPISTPQVKNTRLGKMKQKWGKGFTSEEYEKMESLFTELQKFKPKNNIIQTNAIIEYVKLKTKLDKAVGEGDLKDIEKWQKMSDAAAKNAGIKLDQLTAEDFGEGADSWTSLVEMVEEYDSVIPLMPKVKKMCYDDIDFIIWQNVNYNRRLMELPEVEYEDVWKFIDERFIEEMQRRGYNQRQIEEEKRERNATFKELGENYIEPLWLNPNLQESKEEDLYDDEE